MQGNWKIGSNDRDVAKVFIRSQVCIGAAHNPATALPRIQIPPPHPLPPCSSICRSFTSFEIAKEGCTLGWLTMLRAALNNIIPVNHVGQRDVAPGQLSGKVRSYR